MRKLLLLGILFSTLLVFAFSSNPFFLPDQTERVIKFNDIPYDGKRLYIGPFEANSSNTLRYTISNTGRKDLRIGGDYKNILIKLDPSIRSATSKTDFKPIIQKILENKKYIKAGTVLQDQLIRISDETNSQEVASSNKNTQNMPKKSSRPTPETSDMGNGTVVLEMPETKKKRGKFLNPDDCPDLMIKNIEILKVNKYMIAIEYTIKNQGTGAASLFGPKKTTEDNMFLKGYLAATPKFSRSAVEIGEAVVKKEVGNKDGILDRTREFKGKMYFNVRGRTNLTPYLILTLDPYQTVRECNERNNRSYIKIE